MERRLIINADDLGYTSGVNAAIGECSRNGCLRSATIMATGSAFNEAVALAKADPRLGVGVHLTLTEIAPVSPPDRIPDLAGENGLLPKAPSDLVRGLCTGRISLRSVRKELHAQIARVRDAGIVPTHLDGHKHVHVLPGVIGIVAELACLHNIRWVRTPFDRTPTRSTAVSLSPECRTVFRKQRTKAATLKLFRSHAVSRIRRAGLCSPDFFYGVALTGVWNRDVLLSLLEQLPVGVSEIMVHPGNCDADLTAQSTRLLRQREQERDLLLDPSLRDTLERRGIHLISFGDLIL